MNEISNFINSMPSDDILNQYDDVFDESIYYASIDDDTDISQQYVDINLSAEFRNALMSTIKSKYNSAEEAILDNELKGNVAIVEMIKRDANNE